MQVLKIFEAYSEFTGLRHCDISENSGEDFYHKIFNSLFARIYEADDKLTVNLDKVDGYASSFLDEAFGNLVFDFTLAVVKDKVEIISNQEPHWKSMIQEKTYPQWEERRVSNQRPKVTANHEPWFRLINNKLELKVWEVPNN